MVLASRHPACSVKVVILSDATLKSEVVPQPQFLAPASNTTAVTFWRHDIEMVPKLPVLVP